MKLYKPVQIKPLRKVRSVESEKPDRNAINKEPPKDIDDLIFSDEVTVPSER